MSVDSSMQIAYVLDLKSSIKPNITESEIMFFIMHVLLVPCILSSAKVLPFQCVTMISPRSTGTVSGYAYGNLQFSHFQCIIFAA